MFFGHENFTAWLNTKLLTKYAHKRYNLSPSPQLSDYIQAHKISSQQWRLPIDLKRVSLTNLSLYQTDYSIFKYLHETQLDVLQQPPHNRLNVYPEITQNSDNRLDILTVNNQSFIVMLSTGNIQTMNQQFVGSDIVDKILESYPYLRKINSQFLKSFAYELAVKHTLYEAYATLFQQHLTQQAPDGIDKLAGQFLSTEIQTRAQALAESDFFRLHAEAEAKDKKQKNNQLIEPNVDPQKLSQEVFQFAASTLYIHLLNKHQHNAMDEHNTEHSLFSLLSSMTDNALTDSNLLIETLNGLKPITDKYGLNTRYTDLYASHQQWLNQTNKDL